MALVLGTNAGFVTVAPTDDPNSINTGQDNAARAFKDVSPAGVSKITEVGWWCDTATPDVNFEVGLYSHDAGGDVPLNRLFVSATNAKGTTAGWKRVTVDWTIVPGTTYWIAVQLDNTTPNTAIDYTSEAGNTISTDVAVASLGTTWVSDGMSGGLLAVYALVGSPITIDSVDLYLGLGSAKSGWNINVSITDFGSFSAAPDATAVLGTKSRDVSVVTVGSGGWVSFVFDTPITISESGFIGLNVTTDAPSSYVASALRWYNSNNFSYFTGSLPGTERCYRYDGSWYSIGSSSCLAYRINCTGSTDNVADTPLASYLTFGSYSKMGHRSYMDAAGASSTVLINSTRLGVGGLFILCTTDDGVYISTDFGGTWAQKLPDGAASIVWDLGICSGDGTYMIVERSSDNALYRSGDTGTTWGLITPAGADSFSVSDMAISQDGQFVVVVGTNATDSSKSCYKSTDYGVTWTSINPTVTTEAWTRCDISDDGNLITVSKTNKFYASFNGGTTWKEQFPPATHQVWDDLSVSGDGKVGIVTNLGDTNEFFKTQSWESVPTVSTTTLTAFIRTLLDDTTAAGAATTIGLGTGDSPTFAGLTLTSPLVVGSGGTGVATLTDHGLLLGSGTGAITPLGVATNGQIPIGSTGADPVLAGLTGTTNQITVTNAAGSITLSTPQDIHTAATPTFAGLTLNGNLDLNNNDIVDVDILEGDRAQFSAALGGVGVIVRSGGTINLNNATNTFSTKLKSVATANVTYSLPSADGGDGNALTTDGAGNLSWTNLTGVPGGLDTQVQFNDGGTLAGDSGFTFNKTTNDVTITGNANIAGITCTNATPLTLKELTVNGTNYIGHRAPDSLTVNTVYIWPADDVGNAGYVLETDGAGTLSWAANANVPGGDNYNVQYNSSGSLGGDSGFTWTYDGTPKVLNITGAVQINATNELRFRDTDNSNYVGFEAPGTISANKIWVLPAADGSSGQVLKTDGSGNLSFANVAIANGGTGQITAQAACDAITQVSGGTNEYVLTKDTASGNALWKAVPGALSSRIYAYNSTDQSVNDSTWTKISFETEVYDNLNEYNNTTYRFTATTAGYYMAILTTCLEVPVADKYFELAILRNAPADFPAHLHDDASDGAQHTSNTSNITISLAKLFYLDGVDDYLEGWCYHNMGVAKNISGNKDTTYFQVFQVQ